MEYKEGTLQLEPTVTKLRKISQVEFCKLRLSFPSQEKEEVSMDSILN